MYINPDRIVGICQLQPTGTNSTFFTECCQTAITNTETVCPRCKRKVIGYDAKNESERERIRWGYATSHWKR